MTASTFCIDLVSHRNSGIATKNSPASHIQMALECADQGHLRARQVLDPMYTSNLEMADAA
jgi:hypothetical protein